MSDPVVVESQDNSVSGSSLQLHKLTVHAALSRSLSGPDPGLDPGPSAGFPTVQGEPLPPPYSAVNPGFYPPPLKPGEEPMPYQTFPEPGADPEPGPGLSPEVCSDEAAVLATSAFEDKTVRRAFVRKVFSLVFLQLLFTFSVVCIFTFSTTIKSWCRRTSGSTSRPTSCSWWCCCRSAVVTVTLSYMVGTIASYHDTMTVVLTMGSTLAISLAIIAYSIQSRYDFTVCYGLLLILSVDLIMFGVFSTFYYSHMADVAYGALGALLFSLFLMADVQMMMGTMSYRLSPEEYVYAALTIYLDIVLIFLYLLGRR
ncbi:hypothetical protein WMY93_000725 [Mugilogobius chulae]|uniref:Protein lifeguard 1-like n=1 Tax=Mugilogobius chulae TaxID=88201 RepID=A0AAW0QAR7_9GOBI